MFTGLIEATGQVRHLANSDGTRIIHAVHPTTENLVVSPHSLHSLLFIEVATGNELVRIIGCEKGLYCH